MHLINTADTNDCSIEYTVCVEAKVAKNPFKLHTRSTVLLEFIHSDLTNFKNMKMVLFMRLVLLIYLNKMALLNKKIRYLKK